MTQSTEDYLEAIFVLSKAGEGARVRDIAAALHVKMPSVNKAVLELKRLGLVDQEPYQNVMLTARGRRLGRTILGRHNLLRDFLLKLGVSPDVAGQDACLMEHFLSAETLEKIRDFVAARG